MADNNKNNNNDVNIKEIVEIGLSNWYWFVISVAVCLCIAIVKIERTQPEYSRTATLLIKESNVRRSASSEVDVMMAMTQGGQSKLSNEIIAIKSPNLMESVVRRLNANVQIYIEGRRRDVLSYGSSSPFYVSFLADSSTSYGTFRIKERKDGTYEMYDFYIKGDKQHVSDIVFCLGDTLQTALGTVAVSENPLSKGKLNRVVRVEHKNPVAVAAGFSKKFNAEALNLIKASYGNSSDVLSLSFTDYSIQRAEDVINTVIAIYNENWLADNNMKAVNTSMFIDDRLVALESELGDVDTDISSFKSRNLIPDIEAASNIYLQADQEIKKSIQDVENQIYVTRYIRNYLNSNVGVNQLIPMASSVSNAGLSSQISEYNKAILYRNDIVANSSEFNPIAIQTADQIAALRESIIISLDNQISTLNAELNTLNSRSNANVSKLSSNPDQSKYIVSATRQQKVKESLYLYLLQRREENELSKAFAAYNTRVITAPYGSDIPVAPQKSKILLLALLLGLCIPAGVLYLENITNTKVRGRKDMEGIKAPFLGEIPLYLHNLDESSKRKIKAGDHTAMEAETILVKPGKRDLVNEAFRVLRANIEFMSKGNSHPAILITSFNPGSGKSFIAVNTAVALAINGKKVLVVDCDFRRASTSQVVKSPKKGFADYLAGNVDDVLSVIKQVDNYSNVSILPVGTIPPNPSELISSENFSRTVKELVAKYDYVFLDCPPIDMFADTQLVAELADRTVFVVRAGLLERSMLPSLNTMYDEGKYKNMSVLLNGTESGDSRYGSRYGYKYSYHYSHYGRYGYGYGYGGKKAYDYYKHDDAKSV